ncbi:yqgE [Perkinsela sp. CCAP 1560/4]|nr:yqgE [Perkinsela sp. CCAP 1560/4]|eukprot:KNH05597.1 yqgE [Perkinsela sp. CCAP 1560/4]
MQNQRLVHISLVRSLLKAARRIDDDHALRAVLTTPAEYTNMYNHYGERWEGPLMQNHELPGAKKASVNQAGARVPISHALFSFLQSINGGKSFYNPMDPESKKLVYPAVIRRIRDLAKLWKDATDMGMVDAKLLSSGFFAMKCIQSVFELLPVVESNETPNVLHLSQSKKGQVKSKKTAVAPQRQSMFFEAPKYLKSIRVLDQLPVIYDSTLDCSSKDSASKKGSKEAKKSSAPDKMKSASGAAYFLVAHPMLDQCFRHAIILMSSHKPEKVAHSQMGSDDIASLEISDEAHVFSMSEDGQKISHRESRDSSQLRDRTLTGSEHNDLNSSMGWVINQPMRAKSGDPLRVCDLKLEEHDQIFKLCLQNNIVFSGGPVGSPNMISNRSQHALFLLYCGKLTAKQLSNRKKGDASRQDESQKPKVLQVAPGVLSISDLQLLQENIQQSKVDPREILVVLGYSGWGKSQLEGEILQGTWFTTAIDDSQDVRSVVLSYQKNDDDPVESANKAAGAIKCKASTDKKKASTREGGTGMFLNPTHRGLKDFSEVNRVNLFSARQHSTTSNLPLPVKMWREFLHSMGKDYTPMSRLSAVLPLRVMSP